MLVAASVVNTQAGKVPTHARYYTRVVPAGSIQRTALVAISSGEAFGSLGARHGLVWVALCGLEQMTNPWEWRVRAGKVERRVRRADDHGTVWGSRLCKRFVQVEILRNISLCPDLPS